MSDSVSRKALLKFLYANYEENKLSQAGKALDYVIKKIEAGSFPSTETEKEIESLKAITELAVKGLEDIDGTYSIFEDESTSMQNIAQFTLKEIRRLQNAQT